MHQLEIEAVYERGVLKLPHELPLLEGQKVALTIQPVRCDAQPVADSLPATRDPKELRQLNDLDENSGVSPEGPEEAAPPLAFWWSKSRAKIRSAAKAYSEQTDADY